MRLIDADELKEYITKGYEEMKSEFRTDKYRNIAKMVTESFCKDIDEAPTVDTECHAHWEWDDELGANVCSSCGRPTYDSHDEYVEFMGNKVLALVSPYYCGYCGARMDESTMDQQNEVEE